MSWPTATLGELGRVNTGSTPKTSDPNLWNGDIPFVTSSELGLAAPIISAKRYLSGSGAKISRIAPAGAVLVCCIGSLGKTGIAGRAIVPNQQINWVEFDQSLIWPRYGYYACNRLEHQLGASSASTTLPIVNKSKFSELTISVPPLDEQRRIASILDMADALRLKCKRALGLLDSLTQSIFLEMFGRSSGFEAKPLTDFVDNSDRINYGVVQPGDEVSDGVNLVRVSDLKNGIVNHTKLRKVSKAISEKHGRSLLRGNEILISCVGSIGEVAVATTREKGFNIARAVARIPIVDDLLRAFVAEYLRSPIVQEYFVKELRTVSQPTLNIKQISETLVPMPPPAKLQEFLERRNAVWRIMHAARAHLANSDAMFSSLQSRAFSGQL